MKNIYYNIIFLGVQILAAVIVAQSTFAQQKLPDFNAEIYREALQNIVDYSGGKINREEALKILLNYNNKYPALNIGGYRSDTIYTVPEIAFAAFDQTSVSFHFYPEDTFFEDSLLVS
ncbi:MAG: hypothetical protein K9H16_04560, partial [Bacteroidales bacterium]|nr:hypothetical protein [Bacteroidales bacterium]